MPDADLLLPLEKGSLRGEYRNYFVAKRINYFASIRGFPELWDCFQRLDEIWTREFSDLQRVTDTRNLLPSQLFMWSHAQFRVAFEIAFSTCLNEACNIARSSIEAAVQAHKIYREPSLSVVWSSKNRGLTERACFDCFYTRLDLDAELVRMRTEFEALKSAVAQKIVKQYNIKPPIML